MAESEQAWSPPAADAAVSTSSLNARWAFVTTSLAALIVGSMAFLAMQTTMPTNARGFERPREGFMPYHLFQNLTQSGSALMASLGHRDQINKQAVPVGLAPLPPHSDATPGVENRSLTLDSGDTLAGMLESVGVNANEANTAIEAMRKVYDPRNLRAGLLFDLTLTQAKGDNGDMVTQLTSLKFSPSIEHDITVTRAADGSFSANDAEKKLVVQQHHAAITIDSSLYLSAMRAGIPADVVVEMIHMFSYKVDFQRDIHPGDSFEVFYDYYYTPQGQAARVGNISFARMKLAGREVSLYRFQSDPNSPPDYFDAKGQSAKGMLMKTPVDGARITSGFGMRFHPVLGFTRMHKGVDFGVPIGTPVMAAGGGTVAFAGWMNGYGNFVLVNHGNGWSTGYGHLSRIGTGIHIGSHVRQAQVIAASGMTGIATGPHLHYEIRLNNQQVNPLTVKMADGRKLTGHDMRLFEELRDRVNTMMAKTKLETKIASTGPAVK
ncbi:MAG: M23 family metallopeptidase [Rhizomicrobium sp.]